MAHDVDSPSCAVQDILMGQNELCFFVVEEEVHVNEEEAQRVVVPTCPYELNEQQSEIFDNIRHAVQIYCNGIEAYFAIQEHLMNNLPQQYVCNKFMYYLFDLYFCSS